MAATQQQLQNAENMFNSICNMLNSINFRYDTGRRDEDFVITCTVNGDDIPMKMFIHHLKPFYFKQSIWTSAQNNLCPFDSLVPIQFSWVLYRLA